MLLKIEHEGFRADLIERKETCLYEVYDQLCILVCKVFVDYSVGFSVALMHEPEIKPLFELIELCIAEIKPKS